MRITACSITDYKRVRSVRIRPDADRAFVLIAGKNAQGKSSVLDALTVALGGKRYQAADPVRHGAKDAEIIVELDGGALVIRRVIATTGESTLEVRGREGPLRAPQAALDKLIGARFLDPISFLSMAPKDQRGVLLDLIDKDKRIAQLDVRRARIFDHRTEVGRDLTKAKGELARLPEAAAVPTQITVASIATERAQLGEAQRARDRAVAATLQAVAAVRDSERTRDGLNRSIAQLREQITKLAAEVSELEAGRESVHRMLAERTAEQARLNEISTGLDHEWTIEQQPRAASLDAELARADDHNATVFRVQAANERRVAAEAAVTKLGGQYDTQTVELDKIDAKKIEILEAAALPAPNLSVDDGGITLAGVPFAQASRAEQVKVALALAIAAAPGLDDIWVRDGAVLDDESLAAVVAHAASQNRRLWIERVGTSDAGAIVIVNGEIATS